MAFYTFVENLWFYVLHTDAQIFQVYFGTHYFLCTAVDYNNISI